ncbi:DUF819 domain-containing protein [Brachyspira intermedia]|uniref:DUF819 family protein n=1 Tax=Brachyspira intermedia TaxID=84377 RepID=UPI003006CFB0
MDSLISADNYWALWAIVVGFATLSIVLEQKYKWASTISGVIIALVCAMTLSNLKIIPMSSQVYDIVWDYAVPLAIPLLLIKCDVKKIVMESGKILVIFLIGSFATTAGSLIAFFILKDHINELEGIAAMITGTYIGGTVNFAALSNAFNVSEKMVSSATVADNLLMALYFFILISIPSLKFFRKHYKHPYIDKMENVKIDNIISEYWKPKEISLKDIAISISLAFIIVAVSNSLSAYLAYLIPKTNFILYMINGLLGNKYLIMTTISTICAVLFPNILSKIGAAQEIGTFLIYLFFFVIGVPASLTEIIKNSPLLLVFCSIVVFINMLISFIFGKIFKFNLEDIILASNANIGGPTTAAAMAISKGWIDLVGPVIFVGTFGYVIGTYFGVFIGNLLLAIR